MSQQMDRQEMAMRYLLGTLSEEERTGFEEQFFARDDEFEELEIAEDELVDRYVRSELSTEDARRFEKLLASPRISERVELARILATRTSSTDPIAALKPEPDPPRVGWWGNLFGPATAVSPAFRPAFAASLTLMMLATVALVLVWMQWRRESQRLAAEQQQLQQLNREIQEQRARLSEQELRFNQTRQEKEELEKRYRQLVENQQQPQPSRTSTFSLFLLRGGGSRGAGGGEPKANLTKEVTALRLELDVEGGDYSRYHAFVTNIDRTPIYTRRNLSPIQIADRKFIRFRVPAKSLQTGSYNVRVEGVKPTGASENFEDYTFEVVVR